MIALALAVALLPGAAIQAQPAAAPAAPPFRPDGTTDGISMAQIAPGIYQFTASADGYVEETNSTAIVGRNGVLIFDTNTRPSTTRAVLAMLRGVTDRPVRWIVNSHWHPDHWSGNEVYAAAFPGAEIIASEGTARYMHNVAPAWPAVFAGQVARMRAAPPAADAAARAQQQAEVAQRADFVAEISRVRRTYPTRIYRGALTLDLGGREVRLREITGDADHSTMAYLPAERLILAGDALVAPVTWNQQGYNISLWIDSLHLMAALQPRLIVPGHGPLMRDLAYLNLVIAYMESARAQVLAALAGGAVTEEEVAARVDLAAYRARFAGADADRGEAFDAYAPSLVRKLYLEQRDGMESHR
jgi:glyoxylase-like metal-dependent hydrolase (beta-lactamase superfamily II)